MVQCLVPGSAPAGCSAYLFSQLGGRARTSCGHVHLLFLLRIIQPGGMVDGHALWRCGQWQREAGMACGLAGRQEAPGSAHCCQPDAEDLRASY